MADTDHGFEATIAGYLGECRRLDMGRANAASRAAGLPPVVSAHDRDHALGAVLRMLARDFPEAYRAAVGVVERAGHKMS